MKHVLSWRYIPHSVQSTLYLHVFFAFIQVDTLVINLIPKYFCSCCSYIFSLFLYSWLKWVCLLELERYIYMIQNFSSSVVQWNGNCVIVDVLCEGLLKNHSPHLDSFKLLLWLIGVAMNIPHSDIRLYTQC